MIHEKIGRENVHSTDRQRVLRKGRHAATVSLCCFKILQASKIQPKLTASNILDIEAGQFIYA